MRNKMRIKHPFWLLSCTTYLTSDLYLVEVIQERSKDNDGKHALCKTRLLTALIYLNDGWEEGDGGELAIFRADDEKLGSLTGEGTCLRLVLDAIFSWGLSKVQHCGSLLAP